MNDKNYSKTEIKKMEKELVQFDQLKQIMRFEESSLSPYYLSRPLSTFHVFINDPYRNEYGGKTYKRKGLVICHGHNYNNEIISKIKFIKNWYYVDANRGTNPDLVADITNEYHMSYFPDNYFDCVLSVNCPVSSEQLSLIHIHRIIKKNGVFCTTGLPGLFFWFISDDEFNDLIQQINEIIPEENLKLFKKELLGYGILGPDSDTYSFYRNIILNYNGNDREEMLKLIDKVSMNYTLRFLGKNNFEFIGIKSGILFATPINSLSNLGNVNKKLNKYKLEIFNKKDNE